MPCLSESPVCQFKTMLPVEFLCRKHIAERLEIAFPIVLSRIVKRSLHQPVRRACSSGFRQAVHLLKFADARAAFDLSYARSADDLSI